MSTGKYLLFLWEAPLTISMPIFIKQVMKDRNFPFGTVNCTWSFIEEPSQVTDLLKKEIGILKSCCEMQRYTFARLMSLKYLFAAVLTVFRNPSFNYQAPSVFLPKDST